MKNVFSDKMVNLTFLSVDDAILFGVCKYVHRTI